MFEILDRGGLGRTGRWTFAERDLRTPTVLFVNRLSCRAPPFAEALFVESAVEDARLQVRIRGSYFAPAPVAGPGDLPPTKGLPRSVADLEIPQAPTADDLAVITSEEDLDRLGTPAGAFLANGPEFLRSPRGFVELLARAKDVLGPAVLIGVTGLAAPSNLAALVYVGADLVDSSRVLLDSARGIFHSSEGARLATEADPRACGCEACTTGTGLQAHNELALHREMLLVRNHLAHGRLRELVERRLANDPWNTAVIRHLDLRHYDLVETYTPVAGGEVLAYSRESLSRPEIVRFRRRVATRYRKPPSASVLLLLPCAARKPYSSSRSHRKFREAILASGNPSVVHEVIVTSPLGLVPRELERFYPARAYDIPVTGDWSRDEAAMVTEDLQAFVAANRYEAIVAHLGAEASIVQEALPEAILSSRGRPTADDSLEALTRVVREATAGRDPVPRGRRFEEEIRWMARFQFGDAGLGLVEGAMLRGRFPRVRLLKDGAQVAMYSERGLFSLTLEGGRILSTADVYWVEIEDFVPVGNVFAVGVVDAFPDIRPGDDVVVRHGADVRAVGTARMCAREMVDASRGEAVRVRHAVAPKD